MPRFAYGAGDYEERQPPRAASISWTLYISTIGGAPFHTGLVRSRTFEAASWRQSGRPQDRGLHEAGRRRVVDVSLYHLVGIAYRRSEVFVSTLRKRSGSVSSDSKTYRQSEARRFTRESIVLAISKRLGFHHSVFKTLLSRVAKTRIEPSPQRTGSAMVAAGHPPLL